MPNNDPPPADDPALAGEALRRLEDRLDRASEAAERLIAEAAARAGGARRPPPTGAQSPPKPPPAGWQPSHDDEHRSSDSDIELLSQLLQSVRDLIPPELQRRLAEALRELLLALRALIDFYLERLERRRTTPTEVEDIPIS
jgi:hypothetical protein